MFQNNYSSCYVQVIDVYFRTFWVDCIIFFMYDRRMTLSEYLKEEKITQLDFAKENNFSFHAVAKWCQGQRIPRKEDMMIICDSTNGKVQPNDFYFLHEKSY